MGWIAIVWACAWSVFAGLPFPVGEELSYSVSWNRVPVAKVLMTTEMAEYEGRPVIAIRMRTQTRMFFNKVFKVDDFHESLVDPVTFRPIRFEKNLKEGRKISHELTLFDYETMTASYEDLESGEKATYAIDEGARDILSFMYFMRSSALQENDAPLFRVMADKKIYDLIIRTGKEKRLSVAACDEKVTTLEVEPEASFDGLFVQKGKARLWIARGSRRLMTYAKISVPFGRVRVKLKTVTGPGDDRWVKGKD